MSTPSPSYATSAYISESHTGASNLCSRLTDEMSSQDRHAKQRGGLSGHAKRHVFLALLVRMVGEERGEWIGVHLTVFPAGHCVSSSARFAILIRVLACAGVRWSSLELSAYLVRDQRAPQPATPSSSRASRCSSPHFRQRPLLGGKSNTAPRLPCQ